MAGAVQDLHQLSLQLDYVKPFISAKRDLSKVKNFLDYGPRTGYEVTEKFGNLLNMYTKAELEANEIGVHIKARIGEDHSLHSTIVYHLNTESHEQSAKFYAEIGDEREIQVYRSLEGMAFTLSELSERLEMKTAELQHHLLNLRKKRFISTAKEGKQWYYFVGDSSNPQLGEIIQPHQERMERRKRKILLTITELPGIYISELAVVADISYQTLFADLRRMNSQSLVELNKVGNKVEVYPKETPAVSERSQRSLKPALKIGIDNDLKFLETVARVPGSNLKDLANFVGIHVQRVYPRVDYFSSLGLIRSIKSGKTAGKGRETRVYPTDRLFQTLDFDNNSARENMNTNPVLPVSIRREVAELIAHNPGISIHEAAKSVGLTREGFSHHKRFLIKNGLVIEEKNRGRNGRKFLNPTPKLMEILST